MVLVKIKIFFVHDRPRAISRVALSWLQQYRTAPCCAEFLFCVPGIYIRIRDRGVWVYESQSTYAASSPIVLDIL